MKRVVMMESKREGGPAIFEEFSRNNFLREFGRGGVHGGGVE
jgi:hypothetical protein